MGKAVQRLNFRNRTDFSTRAFKKIYAELLKSGEWDTLLAIDSLSHSFDQSYKLNKKTSAWTRPTSLLDVVPQVGL